MNTCVLSGAVEINREVLAWSSWNGETMEECIAFDTETTLIQEQHKVPDLCLVSVSDGNRHFILEPTQLSCFLDLHFELKREFVCHNVAFDFAVVDRYLLRNGHESARDGLWESVDCGRWHDTMILQNLIEIGSSNGGEKFRSLQELSQLYLGIVLEKNEYRERFHETLEQDWANIEKGFLDYAIKDAIVTRRLFDILKKQAKELIDINGASCEYGLLTEKLQVIGAISLDRITKNGLSVDLGKLSKVKQELDGEIQKTVKEIHQLTPDVWHTSKKTHQLELSGKGVPKENQKAIKAMLLQIAESNQISVPRTAKGEVSLSTKDWEVFRTVDPFIDSYCKFKEKTKLRSFLDGLNSARLYPRYKVLVRTGRTSCSNPNIQQLPRESKVREAIFARPGMVFFIIDYSILELRTLAAECYRVYGSSKMREALIDGKDLHSLTAAMFENLSLEEFGQLPISKRKELRQRAKAFNFGIPGGLGAQSLVEFARQNYGVHLTIEEAERFIKKVTHEIYPELRRYLSDESVEHLVKKLQADSLQLKSLWAEPWKIGMLRKILDGRPYTVDGSPYKQASIDQLWRELLLLCRNRTLIPHIESRNIAENSPLRGLFSATVTTATGRVRGGVGFTQSKNTPFQGLAADGCKQAMWDLTKAGYRLVAFIHDEFVIEIPETEHYTEIANDIIRICRESMSRFVPDIPVECEYAVSRSWCKQAKAVVDQHGKLILWDGSSGLGVA